MSLGLNELEAAVGKMTPGPWTGDRYDGTVKYNMLGADRKPVITGDNGNSDEGPYGVLRSEDEVGIMALRHAAPALIAAARERDELAALLQDCPQFGGSEAPSIFGAKPRGPTQRCNPVPVRSEAKHKLSCWPF
jgi:hypothetical protein